MKIDAHQHFWNYDPAEYGWINDDMSVLKRNYLPADLAQEQVKVEFGGSIAVQARQTLEETRWLLELADSHDRIKGVVGWVDLRSDQVADQLRQFKNNRKFVGVRHVVQDEPDPQFMLNSAFIGGLGLLREYELTYEILVFPKQLPAAIEVVRRFPDQPFVLDHIAKPFIRDGTLEPWSKHIRELGKCPNVQCKLSGMVTEAKWGRWETNDFAPYLDLVFEAFGEDRLMVGSDWPVCLLSGSYEDVIGLVQNYLQQFSESTQRRIFGENAARFYCTDI